MFETVIVTDNYAGNYEREVANFVFGIDTGRKGHSDLSEEQIEAIEEEWCFASEHPESEYDSPITIGGPMPVGEIKIAHHILPTEKMLKWVYDRSVQYFSRKDKTDRNYYANVLRVECRVIVQVSEKILEYNPTDLDDLEE